MARVWFNGEILDETEARVPALDRGFIWGYGLFETLRVYSGRLWAFEEHYARLCGGSDILDLPIPPGDEIAEAMEAVVAANGLSECGTRVNVTRGAGPVDPHADATDPPNVLVTAWPLRDYSALYARGAALVTMSGGGRSLPGVKTTSYAVSVAGRVAARRAGVDDALFCGPDGLVLETTGSNLMAVFGDDLVTPPVADGLLPGVTRRKVLDVCPRIGLRAREEPMRLDDLHRADEVMLTSTLREVYPVRSIDGRDVRLGPTAPKLREAFRDSVRESLGL